LAEQDKLSFDNGWAEIFARKCLFMLDSLESLSDESQAMR
jgi:hypothetical protein